MNKWVKIKDEVFYIEDISMQLTIGAHSNIDMSIDLQKYPEYSDIFFNKFERLEKFNIIAKNFEGRGTVIKRIDIGNKFLNISMRCDYTDMTPIDERREILIDDILNNKDNNNIN
jgi:hypothetical protein